MSSSLRDILELIATYIPEDHETVPFLVLPVIFHLLVLSYLYAYRKTDGAVVAVALFSLSQAVFSSLPTSICPVIFAPPHFDRDQQQSWSLSFFALPALATSLVGLVFLLLNISSSLTLLAQARVDAERRATLKRDANGAASLPETKKDK